MLILQRRRGEKIRIGDSVELTVVRIHGAAVQLGITAPMEVSIHREEVFERIHGQQGDPPLVETARRSERRLPAKRDRCGANARRL